MTHKFWHLGVGQQYPGVFRDILIDHYRVRRNALALNEKLYNHQPGEGGSARLGAYVRRWVQWVTVEVLVAER